MSRIGKTPVPIPEKVTIDFDGLTVTVKGPKGELKRLMPEGVSFDKKDNTVVVSPTTTKIYSRQRHGLCRALIANMVEGVTQGFSKKLEIVGVGRFGTAVCRELISNGADVLAADYSEKAIDDLRQLEPSIEARVVDCTDEESMKESGILEMNTVVVGISEPIEASITTTLIAKDSEGSKVKRVIARATSDLHEKMLKRVGADKVVFPSRMQGERLGLELVRPNLIERLELDNQTGIDEITVPEEFIGRSLRDLNLRKNYLVNVLAAGPAEELTVNPPAKYILERGNILVVMGKTVDLQKLPQN